MARIICSRERKNEANSPASSGGGGGGGGDGGGGSRLREAAASNRRDGETAADGDGNADGDADAGSGCGSFGEKRDAERGGVPSKVTRLAQQFSSASLNEQLGLEPKQSGATATATATATAKRNRLGQRESTAAGGHHQLQLLSTRTSAGDRSCRVKKTVRLFEIDSNRAVKTTNDRTCSLNGGNDGDRVHRRGANSNASGGVRAQTKTTDIINAARALDESLVSARNRLKPVAASADTCAAAIASTIDEKREKPRWSRLSPPAPAPATSNVCDGTNANVNVNVNRPYEGRRCVSMLANVKHTQIYASYDVKTLKNRPLSVAQHFRLEGVLNDAAPSSTAAATITTMSASTSSQQTEKQSRSAHDPNTTTTTTTTRTAPAPAPVSALHKNTSFLHGSRNDRSPSLSQVSSQITSGGSNAADVYDDGYSATATATAIAIAIAIAPYEDVADADSDHDSDEADNYGYSNIDELRSRACDQRHTDQRWESDGDGNGDGDGDGDGDHESNVYDTVVYSELNVARPLPSPSLGVCGNDNRSRSRSRSCIRDLNDDDDDDEYSYCSGDDETAYEVVSPLVYAAESDCNSDSSLEKANSLYETKETTTTSCYHSRVQTLSTITPIEMQRDQGRDIINDRAISVGAGAAAAAAAAATAATTNSSASLASDDWLDVNECESADEIRRKKLFVTKKRQIRLSNKLRKLKRKKLRSYSNQLNSLTNSKMYGKESTAAGGGGGGVGGGDNFPEELCDDFDDTSSEENDYPSPEKAHCSPPPSTRATDKNLLPNVQSQNIYEFMKKARKTVRKSWSSLNQQMRRSSMQMHSLTSATATATTTTSIRSQPQPQPQPQPPIRDQIRDKGSQDFQISDAHSDGAQTKLKNNRRNAAATGSVRWTSFKTKLRPKYSTVSATNSSSIFYLNPEDLRFDAPTNTSNRNDDANVSEREREREREREKEKEKDELTLTRRRTTCLDFNASRPRPSSPPPPPPPPPPVATGAVAAAAAAAADTPQQHADGNFRTDSTDCDDDRDHHLKQQPADEKRDSIATTATSRVSRSPFSSSNSDLNASSCSDLQSRFADEPLYQFYTESVAQLTTNASMREHDSDNSDGDGYEEIGSSTSRPSAMELITPCPNGHGQCRSLWCEVDEVKHSGILEKLSVSRQKLQEAKFEVITSEASYYKSLSVLDKLFANDARLRDENLLCKNDWKILFGNVAAVRKCSQMLLSDLEKCWQDDIMLAGLSDVIYEHALKNFKIFVKYCSNQIYIDRTLKKLRERNVTFVELINELEADPICQSLSLHSFLMLPMQRITRMPLLVDAILTKLDPVRDQRDHKTFKTTLAKLNKIVKDCNENARKFEQYEEMLLLSQQLEFSRKDVKMFSVASSSRWLVKSGPLTHLNPPDAKLTIARKLTKNAVKLYFFLFNDMLVIAKKKSEESYAVVDYCLRNVMQMSLLDDSHSSSSSSSSSSSLSSQPSLINLYLPHRYLLLLTILENHDGKTVEMVLSCDSDSTRQRWLEASYSRLTSDNPEEKLYEEWDCPQVLTVHDYAANQPDELSLQNGDVVKVLKKTTDGWYHGERIRDGVTGWFPANYTVQVASQHTRAKNLKLRHRLLTLSADFLHNQQQK